MEVLQLNPPPALYERVASPSVVYGSWGDQQEGLECHLEAVDSTQFFFTPSSLLDVGRFDRYANFSSSTVENVQEYDLTEDDQPKKLRMKEIIRRLFPKRRRQRPPNHWKKVSSKNEKKSRKDDASVATTVTASSFTSTQSLDDFSVASAPAQSIERDEFRSADPILMDFLRLLVAYEQSASSCDEQVELILPQSDRDKSVKKLSSQDEIAVEGNRQDHPAVGFDEDTPLIQTRLLNTGVVKSTSDFEFVVDRVSKGLDDFDEEEKKEDTEEPVDESKVSHVKTGIWEVICFDREGNPESPFYVVTGVCMEDRVDTKKLRKAIFAGKSYTRRPKLNMAPTEVAEKLAGYKSGTMAPICHSVDLKLFLEENIANVEGNHRINVGSGMVGKCLSISAEKFLQIASMNSKGMEARPLIQKKKGQQPK